MNILIPMAGAGSRFAKEGYTHSKPVIPTTRRRTGDKAPMVVAAVEDLPFDPQDPNNNLIFIVRDFHHADGVTAALSKHYPRVKFITIDHVTEGQACTCLLAKDLIDNDEPLLIAACDNGMDVTVEDFARRTQDSDALIFTFRGNGAVTENPKAYGWVRVEGAEKVTGVSVKAPLSDQPIKDHAIVGAFWFRRGKDFVAATKALIEANDRINGEFYVDQIFRYALQSGLRVKVLEVARYLCWGTPADYEAYEKTIAYWRDFQQEEGSLP